MTPLVQSLLIKISLTYYLFLLEQKLQFTMYDFVLDLNSE